MTDVNDRPTAVTSGGRPSADLATRTLLATAPEVDPSEADELALANRDLRKMARDIAAGDVGPQVLRRRIARRSRGAVQ